MQITKHSLSAIALSILIAGCGSTPVAYHPSSMMNSKDASARLIDLSKNNNDSIEINEEFVKLDNVNRIYFKDVQNIAIYGKVTQDALGGFSVYVSCKESGQYVYRTLNLKIAEQYVDALESLVSTYKEKHKDMTKSESVSSSSAQRMHDLQTLKDKGLITDAEYQQKRKQILDSM